MVVHVDVGSGADEVDVAEESCAGVPAGVLLRHGARLHHQRVVALLQQAGSVNLEPHVAVVGAPDAAPVQVDVTHEHDALEVEQYPSTFECLWFQVECLPVPSRPHLLEATG